MFIATLVAADTLSADHLAAAQAALALGGCAPVDAAWLDAGKAADLFFAHDPGFARRALAIDPALDRVDVIVQPAASRAKKLLVADMDSTMIEIECIDELADYAGIKPEVAEVTERAMRGELDFEAALDARVALLRGLDAEVLDRCHAERVRIMAGARPLIATMRARGARCVLVSGGFTHFADRVAAEIGFHRALSNTLDVADRRLAGTVSRPIVGAATKRETLLNEAAALEIDMAETMAVGDGANDIAMIEAAGLGVAYHGKAKVRAAADAEIVHGDLSVLLYAQGYAREDWVTAF